MKLREPIQRCARQRSCAVLQAVLLTEPQLVPRCVRRSRIWSLAGVDEISGDFSDLDVEVLGGLDVEGLVNSDPLAFDEDPLGLTDQLSSDQGDMQVLGTSSLVFVGTRDGPGETCHRREERPPAQSTTPKARE